VDALRTNDEHADMKLCFWLLLCSWDLLRFLPLRCLSAPLNDTPSGFTRGLGLRARVDKGAVRPLPSDVLRRPLLVAQACASAADVVSLRESKKAPPSREAGRGAARAF
jgi:hypothetical protein